MIMKIIVSSAHLGVFPETFPSRDHIDWLPVDKLSKILVEILSSASQPSTSQDLRDQEYPDEQHPDEEHPDKYHPNDEVPKPSNHSGALRTKTYHVTNPQAASWSADFAADVLAAYPNGTVHPVPFAEWLQKLKASAEFAEFDEKVDVERNPAIRLVEFYSNAADADKGQRVLPTTASTGASATLRDLGPLKRRWLEGWMVQWGLRTAKDF